LFSLSVASARRPYQPFQAGTARRSRPNPPHQQTQKPAALWISYDFVNSVKNVNNFRGKDLPRLKIHAKKSRRMGMVIESKSQTDEGPDF